MSARDENIAAICYGVALLSDEQDRTFYQKHGDGLEGTIGVLQWLIDAAEVFTSAEEQIERGEAYEWDWYLATDGFVADLVEAEELPDDAKLLAMALRNIEAAKEQP